MQLNECCSLTAPSPGCASVHADQDTFGLLCCQDVLLTHNLLVSTRTSRSVSTELLPSQSPTLIVTMVSSHAKAGPSFCLFWIILSLWMATLPKHSSSCEASHLPCQQLMFSIVPSLLQVLILIFKKIYKTNTYSNSPAYFLQHPFSLSELSLKIHISPHRPALRRASLLPNHCFNFYTDHKNFLHSYQKSVQRADCMLSCKFNLPLKTWFS